MKIQDFATLFVRFLALYVIVKFALSLPQLIAIPFYSQGIVDDGMGNAILASTLLSALLYIASAVILWMFSSQVGSLLARGAGAGNELNLPLNFEQAQQLGLFLIGVYLLSFTIPETLKVVLTYFNPAIDPRHIAMATNLLGKAEAKFSVAELVFLLGKLLVGIVLVLGSGGLVGLVHRVRTWGRVQDRG